MRFQKPGAVVSLSTVGGSLGSVSFVSGLCLASFLGTPH